MGTHAMVGYWNIATGKVMASYIHYDGYVNGVGDMLVKHYNDDDSAWMVANGGYLSSLVEDYEDSRKQSVHADPAEEFTSVDDYLKTGFDYAGAPYVYLWDGENWFCATRSEKFTDVETLLDRG